MSRTPILRGVSALTGVGLTSALVVAGVTAPSVAATSCEYPPEVVTSTAVQLSHSTAQYGDQQTAVVTVTSGAGTPDGNVHIVLEGVKSWDKTLTNGSAVVNLPRDLSAQQTYQVSASYDGTCTYQSSSSSTAENSTKFLTVQKAKTGTAGRAPDINKGALERVSFNVRSATGVTPKGKVRVTLWRGSHKMRSKTTSLDANGHGFIKFFGITKRGSWTAVIKYRGNKNFKPSARQKAFKVS